jgi:tRNA(Ile)-lysidine synthetase-like protein
MASTAVIDFWKAHPQYWLPLTPAAKAEADTVIRDTFWCFDRVAENLVGRVIYLDQFSRHFQRVGLLQEKDVRHYREEAAALVRARQTELRTMDEVEILFCLMPFKHLGDNDVIFRALHKLWFPAQDGKTLLDFPTLQRFYIDTYKKTYTLERLRAGFSREAGRERSYSDAAEPFTAATICDSYPVNYAADEEAWVERLFGEAADAAEAAPLREALAPYKGGVVSLSGGVDSMVMLALLAATGADVRAVHIVYGNRPEAADEAQFLLEYCQRLDVHLTIYKIPLLRRGQIDRDFYEAMTRQLRFWVYQCVAEEGETVFLGHIQDDVVENIWTNIASGTHLGDLKKMRAEEVQMGVRLARPFLAVQKRDIYAAAERLAVPYLKNTTPSWSNRGKFREHFHAATVAQFGAGVDARLVAFAEAMQRQTALVQRFVYEPIYRSWVEGTVCITTAVEAELDQAAWAEVFTHLCHTRLDCSKPSAKAVGQFWTRLMAAVAGKPIRVNMSGEFHVRVWRDTATWDWWMKFITES